MDVETRRRLKELLTNQRVLSLSVVVQGRPYVGLLPYALKPDFTAALVHASKLAHHSRGLKLGAPFATLVHAPDDVRFRPSAHPACHPCGRGPTNRA